MQNILKAIVEAGGTPYMVGGYVRDRLLGIPAKDVDIEVFGIEQGKLIELLSQFGKVDTVGVSFGVIKLKTPDGKDYDFSLPRRDSKTGSKHTDFTVTVDHTMTYEEAASRRDFTINSMGMDINGNLRDPFWGECDLKHGTLKATSEAFKEDPLRVLRGFQFASRFNLHRFDKETLNWSREVFNQHTFLAKERVWGEWEKWALKGICPSVGLDFLLKSSWVGHYKEILNIIGVPQSPIHHPEGCVWTHTKHVCDEMSLICERESIQGEDRVIFMFAALCHDFGKAFPEHGGTTKFREDKQKWVAYGHAKAGVPLAERFLSSIGCPIAIKKRVLPLVEEHMFLTERETVKQKDILKLANRLGVNSNIHDLLLLMEADHSGRPPLPKGLDAKALKFRDDAIRLGVYLRPMPPIITGKLMLEHGFKQGKVMGDVLKSCYEAQLNQSFDDLNGGLKYLQKFNKLKG